MDERKKNMILWLLLALSIVLFIVIMWLCFTYRNKQDKMIDYYKQKITQEQGEIEKAEYLSQVTDEKPTELSLSEANKIYEKAGKLYFNSPEVFNISDTEEKVYISELKQSASCREITNFYEVLNNTFTEKGKQQYLSKKEGIAIENGKVYTDFSGKGGDVTYVSTELILKTSENNKMEYVAKAKYIDDAGYTDFSQTYTGNNFRYEESPFVLVYENGTWLIDDFTMAY